MKNKILYFFLVSFFIIILTELSLRVFYSATNKNITNSIETSKLYKNYSLNELDRNLVFRHKYHGGKCLKKISNKNKLNWHPRYGYYDKTKNLNCINKLFSNNTTNIVFFGGSVMANNRTPNYLTSIEYYAFKENIEDYRSVNFAVAGSRLSNELAQFIEYIPKINNIDLIIFLDGINEFQSVRYNGLPNDDYHWTAGVKLRVHEPLRFFLDVLIDRSKIIEIILINGFDYKSSRISRNRQIDLIDIEKSFDDYKYRKKILTTLCQNFNIKCLFILHPVFYTSDNLNGEQDILVNNYTLKYHPNYPKLVKSGYNFLYKEEDIIDLTKKFNNQENIFFDEAHTNKVGAEILGIEIFKLILENNNY